MAKDTNLPWNTDWIEAQKQYLDALSSITQGGDKPGSFDSANVPWSEAFRSRQQSGSWQGTEQQAVFDNLLHQSTLLYSISEQFAGLLKAMSGAAKDTDDWQSVMEEYLAELKKQFSSHAGGQEHIGSDSTAYWHDGLQRWFREMSTASIFPHGFMQFQKKTGFPDLNSFFSSPGLGPSREFEEQLKENARRWQDYLDSYQQYQNIVATIGRDAIDKLRDKILQVARDGKKIGSLRELYDLWISAQEEAYAQKVFTEDYAELHGRLLNSLMSFRKHNQLIFDQALAAHNLPTAEQLGSIKQSQEKLRRDVQHSLLQQEANQSEIETLKKELEAIQQGLSAPKKRSKKKKT